TARLITAPVNREKGAQRSDEGAREPTLFSVERFTELRREARSRTRAIARAGKARKIVPRSPSAIWIGVASAGPTAKPRFPPTAKRLIAVARRAPELACT